MMIATGRGGATRLVWARAGEPGRWKGIAVDQHRTYEYTTRSGKRAEAHFAAAGRPGKERARAFAMNGAAGEGSR